MEGFSLSPAGCKLENFDFFLFFPEEGKWKYYLIFLGYYFGIMNEQ